MKYSVLAVLTAISVTLYTPPARALDVSVSPQMQACSNDSDCTMVDGQCGLGCGFVPLNRSFKDAFDQQKLSSCGSAPDDQAQCVTQPPLVPTCINHRCTVGNAYQDHASAADYTNTPTPGHAAAPDDHEEFVDTPPPAASAAGTQDNAADYTSPGFDDKHGFTAYNLKDQGASTTKSLGLLN